MAPAFLFTWRLLLFLLSLFWVPLGAGTKIIPVLAPAQVSGFVGETVTLPCQLHPPEHNVTVTQVTWTRQRPAELARSVAVFHPIQGPSFHESSRLEFTAAKPGEKLWDASLAVRELRVEDEANYTCQFATFPNGDTSARTQLRVLAQPQNEAETLDIPLSPNPVPAARCVSTGGHPPARISWSSDGKTNTTQVPGPLPGTVTVISLLILTPSSRVDGRNVTCRVEHESFKEPVVLPITLAVSYPPEVSISGYDDNWYIGRREVALNCDIRSKPEPVVYNWSTTNGTLPSSAVAQGTRLQIRTVDETINVTFICLVTNALGTSQANVTVLVRERPGEQSQEGLTSRLYIILFFVILFVLLLVFLIYLFWRKRSSRNKYSPTDNGHCHSFPITSPVSSGRNQNRPSDNGHCHSFPITSPVSSGRNQNRPSDNGVTYAPVRSNSVSTNRGRQVTVQGLDGETEAGEHVGLPAGLPPPPQ